MAETAIDAESICRACTGLHYGDKIHLLGTPTLTELYSRLSASNLDPDDSLPKQICSMCFNRLNDFKQFQEMCVASYKLLLVRFPKYVDLKEISLASVIKHETPEIFVSDCLAGLSNEEVDFPGDHASAASEGIDRCDYEDDQEDADYDPLNDDGKFNVNTFEEKTSLEVKHCVINVDSDDEILAEKVKKSNRGRKRNMKQEEDVHDDDDEVKLENEAYAGYIDDRPNGEEEGETHHGTMKGRKSKLEGNRMQKHKTEPYACLRCPRKFYKKERWEGHIRQHEGLKPYACPHCHKQYSKALRLKNHVTNEHSENPMRFSCSFDGCSKVYRNRESLNWHINVHFNPPKPVDKADRPVFICELCGKALSSRGALREHEMMHRGEFPFACDKCPKRFRVANKLRQHKLRHEGIKNYECTICGMKKTTQHELNMHMNVHTREKQYPCKLCKACFLTNANLVRHIRVVHDRIKLFECTYCDQTFGKAETLKHHVMRHTGEKPHQCPICQKKFIQKTSFQYHVRRHDKTQQKQQQKQQQLQPEQEQLQVPIPAEPQPAMVVIPQSQLKLEHPQQHCQKQVDHLQQQQQPVMVVIPQSQLKLEHPQQHYQQQVDHLHQQQHHAENFHHEEQQQQPFQQF